MIRTLACSLQPGRWSGLLGYLDSRRRLAGRRGMGPGFRHIDRGKPDFEPIRPLRSPAHQVSPVRRVVLGQRETDYADRDIAPIEKTKTKFLIRLEVEDKSGVLAAIAQCFASQGVSIQTVDQNGRDSDAELIIVTHRATEGELKATVEALKKMEIVNKISSVIRVEGAIA